MRQHVTFTCRGSFLAGTLDPGHKPTGLLIVSGGNEVRSGPWNCQADLAKHVAAVGFPVFRYDRRGVGDSEGENTGFANSASDIAAALRAFRLHEPALERIVAFGNCDAASALMLAGGTGCDGLVLANPWTFDPVASDTPAAPVMTTQRLRAHYRRRLSDPRAWLRLLTGKVALGSLTSSFTGAAVLNRRSSDLFVQIKGGLLPFEGPVKILIAQNDRTGLSFLDLWDKADPRLHLCPDASHSFVERDARSWLLGQILKALET
ncbi:hydrolase 1, exosortase A system-associated [Novosphingobium sp.]|uniref:hydrolase 1, exosortase A system-associated n=1 Tax=Novosphingobium sp. TaxID=1874826 RepID=UPI0025F213F4|nr:hydrolase 1, exosortase A system-associated [Novosphingobium sp.]